MFKLRAFMKIAIVGSRNISKLSLDSYIPNNVTEIVSGGAKGIDALAVVYPIEPVCNAEYTASSNR